MTEPRSPSFATLPLAARFVCGWLGFLLLGGAISLTAVLGLRSEMVDGGFAPTRDQEFRFWFGTVGFIVLKMVMAFLSIIALIGLRAPSSVYLAAVTTAFSWPIPQLLFGTWDAPTIFNLVDIIAVLAVFVVLFASSSIGEAFALRTPFNNRKSRSGLIDKIRGRD
jgi:hypothetical protein